ncbi:thermonuclease family protein [Pseudothermotoga sp.]
MKKPAFIVLLITITLVYGAQYTLRLDELLEAKAVRIVGADTFDVTLEGTTVCVRLIGLECPSEGENYYSEAYEYATNMLLDKTVWLELDVEKYDKYGRLLAYVWLKSPQEKIVSDEVVAQDMFNALLLINGYAKVATVAPNFKYSLLFDLLQRAAREAQKGIWALQPGTIIVYITETGKNTILMDVNTYPKVR